MAVLSVSVPDSGFTAIRSSLRSTAALALILALAAATLAAVLSAHTVVRPLRKLSRAAQAITDGNMRQHVDVRGNDEVAVVARAFNGMSERIAQTVDGLSDQIQDLSRGLADLSLVGEILAQSRDVKAELFAVADRVRVMTHSNFCGIHLLDGETMTAGIYAGTVNGSMLAVEELALWVTKADRPATTAGLAQDQRVSAQARRAAVGISKVTMAPVVHQGRPVGAISVGSSGDQDTLATPLPFSPRWQVRWRPPWRMRRRSTSSSTVTCRPSRLWQRRWKRRTSTRPIMLIPSPRWRLSWAVTCSSPNRTCASSNMLPCCTTSARSASPRQILEKPGKLTDKEFTVVARHTLIGERILSRIDYLRSLAPVIRSAHERWDGRGYPDGLAGEAIPLDSRIIFVCDAFHAMTSDRPYRARLAEEAAVKELRDNAGTQFDPAVVAAFLAAWQAGDLAIEELETRAQAAR